MRAASKVTPGVSPVFSRVRRACDRQMPEEKINILMVDDSPTNLLALESILRAPDRNLIPASSGEEALRYLLDHEVAMVLLDVYMPGVDGLTTAELIRGRERCRNIPIIFLTANSTGDRYLTRGYSLGAVDYIVKPVEPDILRSKVAVFVELFKKTREIKRQASLLKQKNQELEDANLARLNMLIDLGHQLAAENDPLTVLARFCRSSRRIVGAEEAGVGLFDNDGLSLRAFFACSSDGERSTTQGTPVGVLSALNRLSKDGRSLRLNEADDSELDSDTTDSVQSFLGAPIVSALGVDGWFYLLNKNDADDFSEADERLAVTLATQVAVAYENARMYAEAQSHAAELRAEMAVRKQAEEERGQLLIRERVARAEAELANRTKDEFLAVLSHELRTPLTAILGWSHLLRGNGVDEEQRERGLETIERNARSQSQLIDDLLDVSRIVTGKLEVESQPVDLAAVINAAIDSVRPATEDKEIKFETTIETACIVHGDTNRLQQVFWNLFTNAVKFTPPGGVVSVHIQRRKRRVQISVTDTGVGIPAEFLPHIFERFRQADGSITRSHGGLGLGLAIVRHLIELHGGSIKAKSAGEDQGTTFKIDFPLAPNTITSNLERKTRKVESESGSVAHSRMLDGLKILVVDDEADARDLVRAILTGCGSDVRCSESAAAAVDAVQEWNPDLLISDIGMPVEDGYTLIKKVRRLRSKRAKDIPAIALTAYATDEDKLLALSAGFQLHLAKPIEPGHLVSSIAAALGRKEPEE
jgi:signal transduction histidine kinase/DNA-binding response OmpR family regulator